LSTIDELVYLATTDEIEPPKTLPEVRKNYLEIMKNRKQQQLERDNEKILSVVGFWQRRVAWWNEDVTAPEYSEAQIQHHFQFGFFKPDVHQVAPKDVIDLKQMDLTDILQQTIIEEEQLKLAKEEMIITARHEEIKLLENDIRELKEAFRDLTELTLEQGCMIDTIEDNVQAASRDLSKGSSEFTKLDLFGNLISKQEESYADDSFAVDANEPFAVASLLDQEPHPEEELYEHNEDEGFGLFAGEDGDYGGGGPDISHVSISPSLFEEPCEPSPVPSTDYFDSEFTREYS